jgi:hypothetical protein
VDSYFRWWAKQFARLNKRNTEFGNANENIDHGIGSKLAEQ